MSPRRDLLDDPNAPKANSLVPAASAVVVDNAGRILAESIVREVREETGIEAQVEKILGVYSNPRHVSVYDDGEVRQQFSVCFLCRAVGGKLRTSKESSEVRFVELAETEQLAIHPSIRLRIQHYAENRPEPYIG